MPFAKKRDGKIREVAVIGLGPFGAGLARRLESLGHTVLGIDIDPHVAKDIRDQVSEVLILDATDEDALRHGDITSFRTVVVAVGAAFEASALITSTLKGMGIPHVIAVSNTDRHREILLRIGADRVILPEEESGYQLADELSIPGMLQTLPLSEDFSMIELKAPPHLVGKGVEVCEPYGVNMVLIIRGTDLILDPDESTRFLADDILVLVGEKRRLAEFSNQG